MKKSALSILISAVALVMLACGCTQNNGSIGVLYGSWVVDNLTVADGGEMPEGYEPDKCFLSFQNNIVRATLDTGHHTFIKRFGTWENSGDYLLLNFTYGEWTYDAPSWLGFSSEEVMRLKYVEESSSRIVLEWVNPQGAKYTYYLKKTY